MSETEVQMPPQKKKVGSGVLAFWISLFLISGTCSLIFGKLLYFFPLGIMCSYETQSIGRAGQRHHFSNFIMFLGMSFLFCRFEVGHLLSWSF